MNRLAKVRRFFCFIYPGNPRLSFFLSFRMLGNLYLLRIFTSNRQSVSIFMKIKCNVLRGLLEQGNKGEWDFHKPARMFNTIFSITINTESFISYFTKKT